MTSKCAICEKELDSELAMMISHNIYVHPSCRSKAIVWAGKQAMKQEAADKVTADLNLAVSLSNFSGNEQFVEQALAKQKMMDEIEKQIVGRVLGPLDTENMSVACTCGALLQFDDLPDSDYITESVVKTCGCGRRVQLKRQHRRYMATVWPPEQQPESPMLFKVGDVVRLKGVKEVIPMTVTCVLPKVLGAYLEVECTWFEGKHNHQQNFCMRQLELLPESPVLFKVGEAVRVKGTTEYTMQVTSVLPNERVECEWVQNWTDGPMLMRTVYPMNQLEACEPGPSMWNGRLTLASGDAIFLGDSTVATAIPAPSCTCTLNCIGICKGQCGCLACKENK